MEITLVGLNHKTASVDIRERLAFDADQTIVALKQLKEKFPKAQFVLLSTCNRVELYCAAKSNDLPEAEALTAFLAESRQVPLADFSGFLYVLKNEDSVRHLLTVTSSLDSMVVGEPQITAQVKESYRLASSTATAGKVLNHLFHCAFSTTKEIYTNTSIAGRRVSVAGVAVDLARQLFDDITSAKVLVVGAGQMGKLVVDHFRHVKCEDITIINRSFDRAQSVAKHYKITADKWANLDQHLCRANIVVTAATATADYLFYKTAFSEIMEKRRGKTLLAIDIAVPRNFEPAINDIENVYLYSVDDLAQVVQQNIELREDDIDRAVEIICEKVAEFMVWLELKDIGPLLGQMKDSFNRIGQSEMSKFFAGSREDAHCKDVLNQAVSRVVNKLLHCVITNIDIVAKEQGPADAAKLANSILTHAEQIIEEGNDTEKT